MVIPVTRPLRTSLIQKPRTQGERIRYARISCGLSQQQLADGVSKISKMRASKSLVSKWELDGVNNPNNANMLAIQAVTGFAVEWLVNGRGAMRVAIPTTKETAPLNVAYLAKALEAACPDRPMEYQATARVVVPLYEILCDTPEIAMPVLLRFAEALRKQAATK